MSKTVWFFLAASVVVAGCDDVEEVRDAGRRPTDAGRLDGGPLRDGSVGVDSGPASDGGGPGDSGPSPSDAGVPAVDWASYLGGSGDESARDVAIDASGNIYVVGGTTSSGFATPGAYDESFNGGSMDVFVAAFRPDGTRIFFTYLGGSGHDRAYAVEVDATGIYVGGRASSGMPTTAGVVQPSFGGDMDVNSRYGPQDGFLAKLSLDGSTLLWLTYLGGPGREIIRDIAIDPSGHVYAAFIEVWRPVPFVSSFAFDTTYSNREGMVAKVSPDATSLVYASYVGGSQREEGAASVRADASGHAYYVISSRSADAPVTAGAFQTNLAGQTDMLLVKVAPDGRSLVYGTFFGGSGNEGGETHNLALNAAGEAYLAAFTQSTDLPTTSGVYVPTAPANQGFVARFASDGASLVAATYLPTGEVQGIDVNASGLVLATGSTTRSGLPVTLGAYQGALGGGRDGFLAVLEADLSGLRYLTYFGGSADDDLRAAAWGDQVAHGVGDVTSGNLPLTPGAYQASLGGPADAMMMRIAIP